MLLTVSSVLFATVINYREANLGRWRKDGILSELRAVRFVYKKTSTLYASSIASTPLSSILRRVKQEQFSPSEHCSKVFFLLESHTWVMLLAAPIRNPF